MTITPDTIITAELLAGLDKCPFCGAEKQQKNNQWRQFRCWTVIYINQLAVVSRSTRCVGYELTTLRARVKELEAVVNDPEALWANWLRGTVKLPVGIGDVRKHQEHIAELENRLRAKFNKSEEDSKHYQERIQRLVEAGNLLVDVLHGDEGKPFSDWIVEAHDAESKWTKAKEGL